MAKLITVAVPTRISVHGSVCAITVVTLAGYRLTDVPRFPCDQVPEVGQVLADQAAVRVRPELGLERACSEFASSVGYLASSVSTALPGITRGIAKLIVIATHAATA